MFQSIEFLGDEVLPEMQKAMSGKQFDDDAGGEISFLSIGREISSISGMDNTVPIGLIPTQDLFDIITEWISWVTINHLEGYL